MAGKVGGGVSRGGELYRLGLGYVDYEIGGLFRGRLVSPIDICSGITLRKASPNTTKQLYVGLVEDPRHSIGARSITLHFVSLAILSDFYPTAPTINA